MMKQSLSLLCVAKRLLKITIWGKWGSNYTSCAQRGGGDRQRDKHRDLYREEEREIKERQKM